MADRTNELITDTDRSTPEIMTYLAKVPEVTLWFWIIKILCTSIGEIGADALTMKRVLPVTGCVRRVCE